jgi:HD superfamily phosphodiesterase
MNSLKEKERQWFALLADDQGKGFATKLELIKRAVTELWSIPRVIPNFTDHGIRHNERVVGYLWDLYSQRNPNPNQFRDLSPEEAFVLLAGVYLHDIGMQCVDPKLFRKVGARVTHQLPADFTEDERTEIRKSHHILSAEMIQAARDNTGTYQRDIPALVNAIQAIPTELISPICDVGGVSRLL